MISLFVAIILGAVIIAVLALAFAIYVFGAFVKEIFTDMFSE